MGLDGMYFAPQEIQDATCEVCPAQLLAFGRFDVTDRPARDTQYDPAAGWRVNAATGAPTCVHPYRVGLPAAAYCSAGVPLPAQETPAPMPDPRALELPEQLDLLEAWFVAVLRTASPEQLASALFRAEAVAVERFSSRDVIGAMRRVMSHELAGR